jgi:hypothetical protein
MLSALAVPAFAATPEAKPTRDAEVAKGIKLVEDGQYDDAIWVLDTAAQRLASDPAKAADLSQAYLYLGIAYVGKGHDAAAKAKFRDALLKEHDLTLSVNKFPPKVIDLFEAARDEASKAQPTATTTAGASHGGGSSVKWVAIGALGAGAVAGGIVLASGSGGGGDDNKTDTFTGTLCGDNYARTKGGCENYRDFEVVVSQPGQLDATITWSETTALYQLYLRDQNYADVAYSNRTSNTSSRLTTAATPQTACPSCAYHLLVARGDNEGAPIPFTLTVHKP